MGIFNAFYVYKKKKKNGTYRVKIKINATIILYTDVAINILIKFERTNNLHDPINDKIIKKPEIS